MKPITRKELADELKISRTTLYRYLKKRNIVLPKGLILPDDKNRIYQKLGYCQKKHETT